jgi:hypothetical protein
LVVVDVVQQRSERGHGACRGAAHSCQRYIVKEASPHDETWHQPLLWLLQLLALLASPIAATVRLMLVLLLACAVSVAGHQLPLLTILNWCCKAGIGVFMCSSVCCLSLNHIAVNKATITESNIHSC